MENKLKGLITFLNVAFLKADVKLNARIDTDNECVAIDYKSGGLAYEVWTGGDIRGINSNGWRIFGMVPIPQTHDTPADMDVEQISAANSVPDVFRKIMIAELNEKVDGWIELVAVELNPDLVEVF